MLLDNVFINQYQVTISLIQHARMTKKVDFAGLR